jgi:hypothetical protein
MRPMLTRSLNTDSISDIDMINGMLTRYCMPIAHGKSYHAHFKKEGTR